MDAHGKESLNFQISVVIYLLVGAVAAVVGMLFCIGWLLAPVLFAIYVGSLVFAVVASVKANEGVAYRYPLTMRMVS